MVAEGLHRMVIPVGAAAGRADRWAADLSGLSRTHVQRLITEGRLTVDGGVVKANLVVGPGTVMHLDVPPPAPAEPIGQPELPLTIVYEDADLLIVNKPSGQVVHPAPGHGSGTLVNALLGRGESLAPTGIAGIQRPGIVHRLDRDTSGLLMVARSDDAQASLRPSGATPGGGHAWRSRPTGGRRRRGIESASDSRAGPCSSSISSPVGPTRSACTSKRSVIRSQGTRSTAPAHHGAGRPISNGFSSMPGGSSSRRPRPAP
jgi:hypothetical protein